MQAEQIRQAIEHSDLGIALMSLNEADSDVKQVRTMIETIQKLDVKENNLDQNRVTQLITQSEAKHDEILRLTVHAIEKSFAELDGKTLDKALVGQTDIQTIELTTKQYQQHVKIVVDKWIAEHKQKVINNYAVATASKVVSEREAAEQKEMLKFKSLTSTI